MKTLLTGNEIERLVKTGEIEISDFDSSRLNPNSYNLRLADTIGYYPMTKYHVKRENGDIVYYLDSGRKNDFETLKIPEDGIILTPGILYLANTMETTCANDLIPCISGRSSFARLGMQIHQTAGFGDIGVRLKWTLEITVVHPIRLYAGQEICQIYFEKPDGQVAMWYNGKYQNSGTVVPSKSYVDIR